MSDAPAEQRRRLHSVALLVLALDTTLFYLVVRFVPLPSDIRVLLQYLVRGTAGLLIARTVIKRQILTPELLGWKAGHVRADLAWFLKCVGVLMAVSIALMGAAILVLRLIQPPLAGWPRELPSLEGLPWYLLNGVLLAALVEEFIYRSLMVPGLEAAYGRRGAIVAGSLIFYVLHLIYARPLWMVHYLAAGAILSWAFLKRRRLWICVALHAGGNILVLLDDALLLWAPSLFQALIGR